MSGNPDRPRTNAKAGTNHALFARRLCYMSGCGRRVVGASILLFACASLRSLPIVILILILILSAVPARSSLRPGDALWPWRLQSASSGLRPDDKAATTAASATMTTFASPSPTLSPKPSFHGPTARRALSDIRRASPSPSSRHSFPATTTTSSSSAARRTKNVSNLREPTVTVAPSALKPHTVDAGTQYSPPGLPPTARWPTSSIQAPLDPFQAVTATSTATVRATTPSKRREPSMEPPEPNVCFDGQQRSGSLPDVSTIATASNPGQATSPSKRPRPDNVLKELPRNYADCEVTDLGVLISGMLMELVRINDKIPLRDGQLTRFHSR